MKFKRSHILKAFIAIVLVGALVGAYLWYRTKGNAKTRDSSGSGESGVPDRVYVLKKGDLVLGILQSGSVNAQKKYKLSLQAAFNTKLAWVIAENSLVKKGDELARFETEDLVDRIDDYQIQVENNEKELSIVIEEEKILLSTNRASIKEAHDRVVDADNNLRKYRRIESRQQRDKLDLAVDNAEVSLTEAENALNKKKEDLGKTVSDQSKREENEQALKKLQNAIDSAHNSISDAQRNLTLFKRYTDPSKITSLENALAQAHLNNEKTKISTASQLVNKRRQISNIRRNLRNNKTRLERFESYLEMMKLVAPVDGVVIYGDPDARYNRIEIFLGMDIRKNRILMTIPDMNNLVVDFDLPEQFRSKVDVGDRAVITPESMPNMKIPGKIRSIETLPVNMIIWDRNSPKIYKSVIELDKQESALVSGVNVQVNIVTKTIKNTLFVPLEAVFEDKERFVVYKHSFGSPKEVEVKLGESNDNSVQILSGLEEGDEVYLYRPYQKKGQDGS
ncbi:MAG: HlyD family efflux transporter periplasmic adaptor subunit [Victivallaceae bacterium]|nr:HlyD family efflux transporter periplasmic adaptor subunit [Victivallaceae bacterium]